MSLRRMTKLLRHAPTDSLQMSEAGWVSLSLLAKELSVSIDEILSAVEVDNKQRFSIEGDFIRAAQGHNKEIVEISAMERSWERVSFAAGETIFHGTNWTAWQGIQTSGGINAGSRTHVHCASSIDSRIGKRTNIDVILEISPEGLECFKSENGVILVREIPLQAIVKVIS